MNTKTTLRYPMIVYKESPTVITYVKLRWYLASTVAYTENMLSSARQEYHQNLDGLNREVKQELEALCIASNRHYHMLGLERALTRLYQTLERLESVAGHRTEQIESALDFIMRKSHIENFLAVVMLLDWGFTGALGEITDFPQAAIDVLTEKAPAFHLESMIDVDIPELA